MNPRGGGQESILTEPIHPSTDKNERDVSLDVIKVISIYFVMIIHVSSYSLYSFGKYWLPTVIVDSFARSAIPMFFMVTGAVLLNKDHDVRSIIKRTRRVLVPLLVWSIIYLEYSRTWDPNQSQSIAYYAQKILAGPTMYHLWYIYALIGVYIFMPVYSAFYQKCSRQVIMFSLIAWYVGGLLIPTLSAITGIIVGINFDFSLFAGYLVLGAFCYDTISASNRNAFYLKFAFLLSVFLVATILTSYFTYLVSIHFGSTTEIFFDPRSPTASLGGAAFFSAICLVFRSGYGLPKVVYPIVNYFSRTCFGVYLIHALIISFAQTKGIDSTMITPWAAIPLLAFCLLVVSSIVVRFIQFIPVIGATVPR